MNVLILCETSGAVREAFRARGHHAWSCDLLPADDGSRWHMQADMWDVLTGTMGFWDLVIAHPSCTYLTVSAAWAFGDGPYHQRVKPDTLVGKARRAARSDALAGFRRLLALPCCVAVENPAPSFVSRAPGLRPPDQTVQPFEFGDDASKRTGLWLKGLPLLTTDPAQRVAGRIVGGRERWANQTDSGQNRLTPGPDRWKLRSKTYPGIATAMAEQWGLTAP